MKQTLVFSLLICFGLVGSIQAQENIVKLGISDLFFKTLNVEYERVLTDENSVLIETGIQLKRNVPSIVVETGTSAGSQNNLTLAEADFTSFSLAGSYRIYTKGEGAKGFYFGPYVRYSSYKSDISGTYNNAASNLSNIPASIVTNLNVFSLGGEVGIQWLVRDKVAINWNIVGLGVSFNNAGVSFTAEDNDVFEAWEQDVQDFLNDLPFGLGDNFSLNSDNATRTIKADANFPFIAFRTTLSIGYAF